MAVTKIGFRDVEDLISSLREVTTLLSKIHTGRGAETVGLVVDAIDTARAVIRAAEPPRSGKCQGCGCTEDAACPGGCHWVDTKRTWCSSCVGVHAQTHKPRRGHPAVRKARRGRGR